MVTDSDIRYENGTSFDINTIPYHHPEYTVVTALDIATMLAMGCSIRLTDDATHELQAFLMDAVCFLIGDDNCDLSHSFWYHTDGIDTTLQHEDLIAIAAHASPADLLTLHIWYSFAGCYSMLDPVVGHIKDYIHRMAERLRGACQAPAEPVPVAKPDTAKRYMAKGLLSRIKRVIDLSDRCIRLSEDHDLSGAYHELAVLKTIAKMLRLDIVGWIPLETWDTIQRPCCWCDRWRG